MASPSAADAHRHRDGAVPETTVEVPLPQRVMTSATQRCRVVRDGVARADYWPTASRGNASAGGSRASRRATPTPAPTAPASYVAGSGDAISSVTMPPPMGSRTTPTIRSCGRRRPLATPRGARCGRRSGGRSIRRRPRPDLELLDGPVCLRPDLYGHRRLRRPAVRAPNVVQRLHCRPRGPHAGRSGFPGVVPVIGGSSLPIRDVRPDQSVSTRVKCSRRLASAMTRSERLAWHRVPIRRAPSLRRDPARRATTHREEIEHQRRSRSPELS